MAWRCDSSPAWLSNHHQQKRETNPQVPGFSRTKPGSGGGGRGASMNIASAASTGPAATVSAVSRARRRVETKVVRAWRAVSSMAAGAAWSGRMPPSS